MDTRLIECFVVVAQTRSFTRAAKLIGMPQPHLSRLVRRLEDLMDTQLIDRSSRQIELTRAGETLLAESQAVLDQVSLAFKRTQAAAQDRPVQRIGYTSPCLDLPLHHGILKFRERHPEIMLDMKIVATAEEQANRLRSGDLHIGMFQFINCDLAGLTWKRLSRLSFVLAIPEQWPFRGDEPLDLAALSDYPFVLSDPTLSPEIHDMQVAYCESAGFRPKLARYGRERSELMMMVASGFGACFLFEQVLRIRQDGIRLVPIANPREDIATDCNIVWSAQGPSAATLDFVDCLSSEMRLPAIFSDGDRFGMRWEKA